MKENNKLTDFIKNKVDKIEEIALDQEEQMKNIQKDFILNIWMKRHMQI
jgi:hypothetical protein